MAAITICRDFGAQKYKVYQKIIKIEIIRVRPQTNRISILLRRDIKELGLSLPCEDVTRMYPYKYMPERELPSATELVITLFLDIPNFRPDKK